MSGAIAVGFTLNMATSSRHTEAELGGSLNAGGPVLVEAEARNVVAANTPGIAMGFAAIAAMIPIATVSGHTTATISGTVSGSTSIYVHAIAENRAIATCS